MTPMSQRRARVEPLLTLEDLLRDIDVHAEVSFASATSKMEGAGI